MVAHDGRWRAAAQTEIIALVAASEPVREALGGRASATVTRCDKGFVGDFKINFGGSLPPGRAESKAIVKRLAKHLAGIGEIDRAVAVPPSVYVRPSLDFLLDSVLSSLDGSRSAPGDDADDGEAVVVAFSSPNANKPLHLGHLRNNFLGMSIAALLEACGHRVVRTSILSDWGVHICQAAVAYERWGAGATPDGEGIKSDAFVGDYYVRFNRENAQRREAADGSSEAESPTQLEREARDYLLRAERADAGVNHTLRTIVRWATRGIGDTYRRIGTKFDAVLQESDMIATGRRLIEEGLRNGICSRRDDGSVFVDLGDREGMEPVTLIRGDGTALVYAQILGAYVYREEVFHPDRVVMINAGEWELGVEVMREVLRRFRCTWVERFEPVYYGLVTLPEGRMKSRAGKVVEADELLDRVAARLRESWRDGDLDPDARQAICDTLAAGLLKYYILGIKREKSLAYDEGRIWSHGLPAFSAVARAIAWSPSESVASRRDVSGGTADARRHVLLLLNDFPGVVERAATHRNPSIIVRFADELVQRFSRSALDDMAREDRTRLSDAVKAALRRCLGLLNIELPPRLDLVPPELRLRRRAGS